MSADLVDVTEAGMLNLHSSVIDELRRRSVVPTGSNPPGPYTRRLVAKTLNFKLATSLEKGFDVTGVIVSDT